MKKVISIAFCFLTLLSKSQTNIPSIIEYDNKKEIRFAKFLTLDDKIASTNSSYYLNQILAKGNNNVSFILTNRKYDSLGFEHIRFQEYFKGIKVYGSEYLVHSRGGYIETINGNYLSIDVENINPSISEAEALNLVIESVNAKSYKWQFSFNEDQIKIRKNNQQATYYPKAELVIAPQLITNNLDKLAYIFDISTQEPNDEIRVFIDANTGLILKKESKICKINPVVGTAETKHSDSKQIYCDQQSISKFVLKELTANGGTLINTLNANYLTDESNNTDFENTSNTWNNSNWGNFGIGQVALDVHWASEKVVDYWKTEHNRLSLDDLNMPINSLVHYGSNYENALWDPTNNTIKYGDGNLNFSELVSLDVCSHEIAHGICQFTAVLQSTFESDALNEGLSDIWAACIENFVDPNSTTKNKWLIAEEVTKVYPYYLRSMKNPKIGFLHPSPDCYGGAIWADMINNYQFAHFASGVVNKWFYILSEGEIGVNELMNAYNVNGLGIEVSAKILYRAESMYLTSSSQFIHAKTATILAAQDLFGVGSCEEIAVTNAWYAVGVGNYYTTPINSPGITVSSKLNRNSFGLYVASFSIVNPASIPYDWKVNGNVINYTHNSTLDLPINGGINGNNIYDIDVSTIAGCTPNLQNCVSFKFNRISKKFTIIGSCNPQASRSAPTRFILTQDPSTNGQLNVAVATASDDEFSKLFFEANHLSNELVQGVRIYDLEGNLLIENTTVNNKQINIDVSGLAEGAYNVEIVGNNDYREQQTDRYTVTKTEKQLAEELARGTVIINTDDSTDRKEVLQQQLYKLLEGRKDLLTNSTTLSNFFYTKEAENFGIISKLNEVLSTYDITTSQTILADWQPLSRQDSNCYNYYNYFIRYLNGEAFDFFDLYDLYDLSNRCPQTDGEIIYAARSLYNYVAQDADEFTFACANAGARSIKKAIVKKAITPNGVCNIYPNPSTGLFNIKFPSNTKGTNSIEVYNIMGKMVMQQKTIGGTQPIKFSQVLPKGIYMVNIKNAITNKSETHKLVVE